MKKLLQDLLVSAAGFITSILTALLLYFVEKQFDLSLYTFSLWFVIPVGAIGAGCLAATGYYFGSILFGHRPSSLILLNMVMASIGAFFLIHYLSFISLSIDGTPISELVSFGTYLEVLYKKTSMTFHLRAAKIGSTGELGNIGYIVAIVQIIGFLLGGILLYFWLKSMAYCEKCSQYLTKKDKQERYYNNHEYFVEKIKHVAELYDDKKLQELIETHSGLGDPYSGKDHYLKSILELKECKKCGVHWLKISGEKRSGDSWTTISDLSFDTFYEGTRYGVRK